ncbi:hypothetical protein F5884DRAFT_447384 [Xylogone sp. PMI_703]|nr:hypothetical protein F5884DRAFT_447384 [Xylogone sp. PMI_703]
MSSKSRSGFLGSEHNCYYATDPRVNKELASSLTGKNVVIAGAGRGIGRAIAKFLTHSSAKTMSLIALEIDEVQETAKECKAINNNLEVKIATMDVRDSNSVETFMKEVDDEFGGADIVIMNAGRPPQWLPTHECDPGIWWDTVAISLQGAFNFSRHALPIMQRKGGGTIIFTSSAGAHSNFGMGSYTMGKLGMVRLCEIIHNENKQHNIKCFAYNPGAVPTRFYTDFKDKVEGVSKEGSYVKVDVPNEDKSAQTALNAFKNVHWDTPEMAAGLVTVIASGKLDFMSGRYLDASKNIEEYIAERDIIREKDLHRVRLHVSDTQFIPTLDF